MAEAAPNRWKSIALSVGALSAIALVWEAATRLGLPGMQNLAPVSVIVGQFIKRVFDGSFVVALFFTFIRMLSGYGISVCLGLPLGIALWRVKWLRDSLGLIVPGLHGMPAIVWLPLLRLWLGETEWTIVVIVVLASVMSITRGTMDALAQIPNVHTRAGRMLGANGWRLYRYVLLPSAMPGIVAGMKQGWAFAWRGLLGAELIVTGLMGVGPILRLQGIAPEDKIPVLLAAMLLVCVVSASVDRFIFENIETRLLKQRGLQPHGEAV
jgi:NitT/TauT family transport system permease protein